MNIYLLFAKNRVYNSEYMQYDDINIHKKLRTEMPRGVFVYLFWGGSSETSPVDGIPYLGLPGEVKFKYSGL